MYGNERDGKKTWLLFEDMSPDASQYLPVPNKEWEKIRSKSEKELEAAGLGPRQSHHLKNWSLRRDGASWKAYLIDIGNCSLRRDTVAKSKKRRDNLRLQPCP
jgi:hypothetical protein